MANDWDVLDFTKVIPGDVIFTGMGQPAKTAVKIGQMLLNDDCRFEHVAIVVDDGGSKPVALEARPPKARYFSVEASHPSLYLRLPLSDSQRNNINNFGWRLNLGDVKYAWLAYPHLSLVRMGLTSKSLTDTLMSSRRRICSQLVDEVLTKSGYQVFDDGRVYGDVTPGDLYYRLTLDPECVPFRLDGRKNWEG